MPISQGLRLSLNALREKASQQYKENVIQVNEDTDIGSFANPIINYQAIQNEFCSSLINRIVYVQFETKLWNNPLKVLEGDNLPLGYSGEEIFTNPAEGRDYNGNDFAGLLKKYEADTKTQFMSINSDRQYPVTINRQALKKAFVSWSELESFINNITSSLYNGAYIDEYNYTKNIISGAYKDNKAPIKVINNISTEKAAKEFLTEARALFLNFQSPSSEYTAWNKNGGYGNPINTFTNKEDIVFLIRNDIGAYLDVNVLSSAFNIDKSILLGNVIYVNNFDFINKGKKIYDGKNIVGFIGDKNWFRIKLQDMWVDDFYNANNRTLQTYLNVIKMYNMSLFANGVIFATEEPTTIITNLDYNNTRQITLENVGDQEGLDINVTPFSANSPSIEYSSSSDEIFTVDKDVNNDRHCTITAIGSGNATLTATAGNVQTTLNIEVK